MEVELPKVPLEAGLGPDNPPCPVCGEPIFPWLELPGSGGLARRCEECGLGILGAEGDEATALADFERGASGDGWIEFRNRASTQASLTGGGWSCLETDRAYLFTPDSVERMLARKDRLVSERRALFGKGLTTMWQSVINTFTFGHNVALSALGKAPAVRAGALWQRVLDWFITAVLAVPAILLAVPLEALGVLRGRCGAYAIRSTAP